VAPAGPPAYTVTYAPADFTPNVDNPWFPLKPGTVLTYEGVRDGKKARELLIVTNQVAKIDGVPCRVVHDRLYLDGTLAETTSDYYTQDLKGNVWYFGEDTATFDAQGNMIATDGTFHAGEAGALPGIFMVANPQIGDSQRQEYYLGHAEDFFQVLDLSSSVTVPFRSFTGVMQTKEWTPLEPDVLDNKYYVKGIGTVKEIAVKGGQEELVLVNAKFA
jgi:hypothetical protein